MARLEVTVELRVVLVGGLADCGTCGAVVHWRGPLEGLAERLAGLRCPSCKGGAEARPGTFAVELQVDAGGRRGREVLAVA